MMKNYVHARLDREEAALLTELVRATGEKISALVKKGLRLVYREEILRRRNALEAAGKFVGCMASGMGDLSYNKKRLEGYGK